MSELQALINKWVGCTRCDLHQGRNEVVFGEAWTDTPNEGDPMILIVGEAPGANEDTHGRPFVGDAGQILRADILKPAGVRLGFITNLLACRPPRNRDPVLGEIDTCGARLDALVEVLEPDGLMAVGRFAREAQARPWREHFKDKPTVAILHPAALLHQGHPSAKTTRKLRTEVAKVRRFLARLGVEPGAEKVFGSCDHNFVTVGTWCSGEWREPMRLCAKCGEVERPTK